MSRPLEVRLREYITHGRNTSDRILRAAESINERFPGDRSTDSLTAKASVQIGVCDDLEKMLNGEELAGWQDEGARSDD